MSEARIDIGPSRGAARTVARPGSTRARRVVAVGGGKGGIGKTLVAANLAIGLTRRGNRVVLVDADLGGANLHTCLGMDQPARSLADFLDRRVERIEDVVTPTPLPGLGLVSGAMDHLGAANPSHAHKMRLLRHVQAIDVDTVVLDLGAGTHLNVLDFFLIADHGILVLVPEPTAVENAYRFVKAAFWRRVRNVVSVYGFEEVLQEVVGRSGARSGAEVVVALTRRHPEAGALVARQLELFRPRLVLNQVRTPQDAELGPTVVAAWRRFFGLEMDLLGHVPHDDHVWRTVRARRPVLVHSPQSPAALSFGRILDRLCALDAALVRAEVTP